MSSHWRIKRVGPLHTLPRVRAEEGRLYREWKRGQVSDQALTAGVNGLFKIVRTLEKERQLELYEREVAARETMARHLTEIAGDPRRYLHSPINVKVEVVDNSEAPRAQIIDGEVVEAVELPELPGPKLQ